MQWQDTAGRLLNSFARCLSLSKNTELPFIPNELVEIIFTMAAASSRESCKQLCLVATWSRQMVLPYLRQTVIISKPEHYKEFLAFAQTYATSSLIPHTIYTEKLWIGRKSFANTKEVAAFPDVFRHFPNIKYLTLPGDCFDAILEEAAKTDAFPDGHDLHITVLDAYEPANTYPREHRHIEPSHFSQRITHLYHAALTYCYETCSLAALTGVKEFALHLSPRHLYSFRRMLPPSPLADNLEKYIMILGDDPVWDSPSRLYIDDDVPLAVLIPELRKQKPNTLVWHRETPEKWKDEIDWNWEAAIKYTAQFDE